MSPAFLLPKSASAAPYFMKLPAIQWYSPDPVRFSTCSPQLRRCSLAPPSPDEPTRTTAPLSAWMLAGLSEANPQPAASNCSLAGGSPPPVGGGPPPRPAGPPSAC